MNITFYFKFKILSDEDDKEDAKPIAPSTGQISVGPTSGKLANRLSMSAAFLQSISASGAKQ